MTKVYVSATFRDLQDYRAAVQLALRRLRVEDMAIEPYVELSDRHMCTTFRDPGGLAAMVTAAVANFLAETGWVVGAGPQALDRNTTKKYFDRLRQHYGVLDLDALTPAQTEDYLRIQLTSVFVEQWVREDPPPAELPREWLRRMRSEGRIGTAARYVALSLTGGPTDDRLAALADHLPSIGDGRLLGDEARPGTNSGGDAIFTYPLSDVFKRNGPPTLTFVEPRRGPSGGEVTGRHRARKRLTIGRSTALFRTGSGVPGNAPELPTTRFEWRTRRRLRAVPRPVRPIAPG